MRRHIREEHEEKLSILQQYCHDVCRTAIYHVFQQATQVRFVYNAKQGIAGRDSFLLRLNLALHLRPSGSFSTTTSARSHSRPPKPCRVKLLDFGLFMPLFVAAKWLHWHFAVWR